MRLAAYADVNEANAALGVAIACGGLPVEVRTVLLRVQNDLFDVGADLCTPLQESYEYPPLRVKDEWVAELEADCDTWLAPLEKLRSFILPGGTPGSAYLHQALTVVRRAERSTWAAIEEYGTEPRTARGHGRERPASGWRSPRWRCWAAGRSRSFGSTSPPSSTVAATQSISRVGCSRWTSLRSASC